LRGFERLQDYSDSLFSHDLDASIMGCKVLF